MPPLPRWPLDLADLATTICLIIANRANGDASADYKPHMKQLILHTGRSLNSLLYAVNHLLIMIQRIQTDSLARGSYHHDDSVARADRPIAYP